MAKEYLVRGPCVGNYDTLLQLATTTIGSKWVLDEAQLRTLKLDITVEFFQTSLAEV